MIQSRKWTPKYEQRRRLCLIAAALLFLLPGVWAFAQWKGLTSCLRVGQLGGSVNVFLERGGQVRRAVIGLNAKRVDSGVFIREEISMSIRFAGDQRTHPFQIRPNDIIVLAEPVMPEFRSVLQSFPTRHGDPSIPLRSLTGNHGISPLYHSQQFDDPTLYGAESLRPSILWSIMAASGLGSTFLWWLAFRSHRRLRRVKRGLCPMCAYPMLIRAGEDIRCSECGAEIILNRCPACALPHV